MFCVLVTYDSVTLTICLLRTRHVLVFITVVLVWQLLIAVELLMFPLFVANV